MEMHRVAWDVLKDSHVAFLPPAEVPKQEPSESCRAEGSLGFQQVQAGLGEGLEAISVVQIRDNKGPKSGGGRESKGEWGTDTPLAGSAD